MVDVMSAHLATLSVTEEIPIRDTIRLDDVITLAYKRIAKAGIPVPKNDIKFIKQQLFGHVPVAIRDMNPTWLGMSVCMQHIIVASVHPKILERSDNPIQSPLNIETIVFDTQTVKAVLTSTIAQIQATMQRR